MSSKSAERLYGRNPVLEVLRAGRRRVDEIWIQEGAAEDARLDEIARRARESGARVQRVAKSRLREVHSHHQGVVALAGPYPYIEFDAFLTCSDGPGGQPLILILDALQDPQNFGTLLRSAEAAGVTGVLIPLKRSAGVTPSVVNASSGASEHMRIARVNLVQAMEALKQDDYWIVGLEGRANERLDELDLRRPLGLVVGSEGAGMRRLVRERCDYLAALPARGRIESLNAAAAGSIALYLVWAQRGFS